MALVLPALQSTEGEDERHGVWQEDGEMWFATDLVAEASSVGESGRLGMRVSGPVVSATESHGDGEYAVWVDMRWAPPLSVRFSRLCITATLLDAGGGGGSEGHAAACMDAAATRQTLLREADAWDAGPMSRDGMPAIAVRGMQPGLSYAVTAAVMDARGRKHTRTLVVVADAPPHVRTSLPANAMQAALLLSPSLAVELPKLEA